MRVLLLISLHLLLYEGLNCQLVFKDSPASTTVLVNFPTTLRCTANEPSPPANIVWLKDGIFTESDPRGRISVSYDPSTGGSEYIIDTVSYLDDGNYQCYAINATAGLITSSSIGTLTVQGHPGFAHSLQPAIVPLGGTAVFECPVLSNPPADVGWTFQDGTPITSGIKYVISPATTLSITDVQATDERFYVCTATNTFGRNSTSARLAIGNPPPELNPTITPSSLDPLVLSQGDTLSLTCSVNPNSAFSSITWSKGASQIENVAQTSNTVLLSIPSVVFEDGGVYACTAVDDSEGTEVVSIRVEVRVAPQFTATPQDIMVIENQQLNPIPVCTAVGEPDPVISWFRADGTEIPLVDGVPQFGFVRRSDAGVFACMASNSAGTIRHEFTVTVQGRPIFSNQPANIDAFFGQDVVFQCEAIGPPEPDLSWSRKSGGLPTGAVQSSDSTRLLLFSVTDEDEGDYACTASNTFGSNTVQATLSVSARPRILETTYGPLYQAAGTTFTLQCTFTGPSSVVQIWSLNGVPLIPSQDSSLSLGADGSLTVLNAQEQYSGEYVCNVTTGYSFDSARVSVFIGSPPLFTALPSDTDLAPGTTAILSCVSTGQPQPWSTWFKTNTSGVRSELPTIGPTFTKLSTGLELHDVDRDDSGLYECLVDNGIGTAQQSATVRVEGAPLVSGIRPTELSNGDTNVTLECITEFGFPPGSVSWMRADGTELSAQRFTVTSAGLLQISSVMPQDQAEYVCVVTNLYGASSTTATITISVAPTINFESTEVVAELGGKFALTCPASGTPTPTIQWLVNGQDITEAPAFVFDSGTGELRLNDPNVNNEGTLTCVATNPVGTASADIELLVRGPAVGTLTRGAVTTSIVIIAWTPPPPDATLLSYQIEYGRPGRQDGRVTRTAQSSTRSTLVSGLLPGTTYEFIVRGLFTGGLVGADRSLVATTNEAAPSGPPQNISVSPSGGGFRVSWMLPLENERNGVIVSYRIFYRVTPENATLDLPFTNTTYIRNETEVNHFLSVSDLPENVMYQVKLLASTAVGDGPESTLYPVTTLRRPTFDPVDFPVVTNAVIGVGAGVLGSLLLVALILALIIVGKLCAKCCAKIQERHERLKEEEGESGRKKSKKAKSVSGPIPGIAPKIDSSTDGKFVVQGEDGRVLNLKPKVIREEDVAPPPRYGENVQVVPHDKILVSQGGADAYNEPADALDGYSVPKPHSGKGATRQVVRPESGIYSEVHDVQGAREETESPSLVRDAAEESDTGSQLVEPDVIVVQPPSPVRGPEGEDTGTDNAQLIYASVSEEHKQKKREKKSKDQERLEAKQAKQEKKMQEKMEREKKKQEERRRKQEEKERKNRSKDQQARASLGLDNVVHLHEIDMSKQGGRAQAQFIDASTAALF